MLIEDERYVFYMIVFNVVGKKNVFYLIVLVVVELDFL